nr:polysaccharide pyruvyl transferase family protein [Candidatus Gracilibacteria bacterium]
MNISIFASIGCQNLGDELILKNEINIFEQLYKDKKVNFKVFSYDYKNPFYVKDNVKYIEYFPIGIKDKKNFFRNLRNFKNFINTVFWSDLIIIGGGGIIYDNEVQANKNPLDQWIFRNKIFRFFGKKIIFYAVGINITYTENLFKLRQIFKGAYKIFVRDNYSFEVLKNNGINAEIIDDPVFYDNSENIKFIDGKAILDTKQKNLLIKKIDSHNFNLKDLEKINFQNKNIGITFRAGYIGKSGNEKIEILMIKEIVNFLLIRNAKIFFLPHSIHNTDFRSNDLEFYNKVISGNLENKVYIAKSIKEVYDVYKEKKINLCLSMRLHSMILSQVYDIPFIAFSYSKKTDELIKKIK